MPKPTIPALNSRSSTRSKRPDALQGFWPYVGRSGICVTERIVTLQRRKRHWAGRDHVHI
jgi:hypothetical protein